MTTARPHGILLHEPFPAPPVPPKDRARKSVVVPYKIDGQFARTGMLDALIDTFPDRPDLEIVLVDDRSLHPYVVRRDFRHARVLHLAVPEGQKYAGMARNHGMERSTGAWIFFADSDDLMDTAALVEVLDALDSTRADLVMARSTSFRDDGKPATRHAYLDRIFHDLEQRGDYDRLVHAMSPMAKFLRRKLIAEGGARFSPDPIAEDMIFAAQIFLQAPTLRLIDRIVYRIREGNASHTSNTSVEAGRIRMRLLAGVNRALHKGGRPDLTFPLPFYIPLYFPKDPKAGVVACLQHLNDPKSMGINPSSLLHALTRICRRLAPLPAHQHHQP